MNWGTAAYRGALVSAAVACMLLILAGIADGLAHPARVVIRDIRAGADVGPQRISTAASLLRWSLRLNPLEARAFQTAGVFSDLTTRGAAFPDRQAALTEATGYFRRQATLRPCDARAWAHIAWAMARTGRGRDPDFAHALRAAERCGPWEPAVLRTIVAAVAVAGAQTGGSIEALALDVAQRGLAHRSYRQPEKMRRLLLTIGWLDRVCAMVEDKRVVDTHCAAAR